MTKNDTQKLTKKQVQKVQSLNFRVLPNKTVPIDQFRPQGERKTDFNPKIQFQIGLWKFFSKISQNWVQNFEKLLLFFWKRWNFLRVFIVAYHLQVIGAPVGFYRSSLTLLFQEKNLLKTGKIEILLTIFFFQKNAFLIGFNQKSPLLNPHKFCRQPFHIVVNTCQKLTISEEKSKISKNRQKLWFFRKIRLLCFPTSPRFWRSIYVPALRLS